jgi:hypothetical protein
MKDLYLRNPGSKHLLLVSSEFRYSADGGKGKGERGTGERGAGLWILYPLPFSLYPFPFCRHALAILRIILKLFVVKHNMDR